MHLYRFLNNPLIVQGSSVTTQALSSSNTKIGARWRAPKTATINRISFFVTALSGTPTLRCGIQGLSGGLPDGSWIQSATVVPSLNENRVTIPDCSVTANTPYATVVEYDSGATSATVRQRSSGNFVQNPNTTFGLINTAGTWSANGSLPFVTTQYADNDIAYPASLGGETTLAFSDASNPDEYGNKFIPEVGCYCNGFLLYLRDNATPTVTATIALFNSGGTQLATVTHTASTDSLSSAAFATVRFWTPVALTAGQTYYIALKAGVGSITTYSHSLGYSDLCLATTNLCRVSRNNGGAWTETATEYIMIYPLVSEYIAGSSSGGAGRIITGDACFGNHLITGL